jgi:hypothetical protein
MAVPEQGVLLSVGFALVKQHKPIQELSAQGLKHPTMFVKSLVPDSDAKEVRQRMPAEERALPGPTSCSNLEPQSKENCPQNREFTLTL